MKKVIVGMSGGVDSAVAAYLLIKEGYVVEGLFMRNWDSTVNSEYNINNDFICPQEQDYNDALEVCKVLNIPLHRVDFVKEYWDLVFTYFLEELKKGRTPNPDLLCNKFIKFDLFKKEAYNLSADYVATGHYARIKQNKLLRALDLSKDQTYFLASLSPNQLKDVLFPLGELTKEEVRNIAKNNNIPVFDKKDSTGICFIGERNYQKFISNYLKPNPGDIINIKTNEIIGTHNGLMNYTLGQRKNINLSGFKDRTYVCGKDIKQNILYVTIGDTEYLYSNSCLVEDINFISDTKPTFCTAKFRYQSKDIAVRIDYLENNKIKLYYDSKAKAVTPGQACVLYLGEECLGGGIIDKIYIDDQPIWYVNN